MAKIILREGEDLDSGIKRFNKNVQKANIINECRSRQYFQKPSVERKEKERQARKLRAAQNRKEQRNY